MPKICCSITAEGDSRKHGAGQWWHLRGGGGRGPGDRRLLRWRLLCLSRLLRCSLDLLRCRCLRSLQIRHSTHQPRLLSTAEGHAFRVQREQA